MTRRKLTPRAALSARQVDYVQKTIKRIDRTLDHAAGRLLRAQGDLTRVLGMLARSKRR